MKTPRYARYAIIPIAVLLLTYLSHPVMATEYPGGLLEWPEEGTYTYDLNVPDSGTVTNVSLFINSAQTYKGFDNNAMMLTSPFGTTIYLFDMSACKISGKSLYLTRFVDTAPVVITEGIPPYSGSFRPAESFSNFHGEWMTGTWTLAVYNDALATSNPGAVTDWVLIINEVTPVPTPSPVITPVPTPGPIVYREYPGAAFSWHSTGATIGSLYIGNQGIITDVNLNISADCVSDFASIGMYLRSPQSDNVGLFEVDNLTGPSLYLTTFDDAASQPITTGVAPYIGLYRPVESLALFNDQTMTGDWSLIIYNSDIGNPGDVADWSLIIACWDYLATPTPTPKPITPTPSLTPIPTPTPKPTPYALCYEYPGSFVEWTTSGLVKSDLVVSEVGSAIDVIVTINSAYTSNNFRYNAIQIQAPSGNDAYLFKTHADIGEFIIGNSLYQTKFDDSAWTVVTEGSSPYIGSFRPVVSLSNLDGEDITGTWSLVIYNGAVSNEGYINNWTLRVCVPPPSTPTPPPSPTPSPIPTSTHTPPLPTPIPILQSGDYDGDGTSDIGVFRSSSGLWSVRGVGTSFFGEAGDLPASGDYDGDGTTDLAIFRSSAGFWAVSGVTRAYFGSGNDISVPGDYNGDGTCEIGVFRGSSSLWAIRGLTRAYFGSSGDYPMPGDYDGDGLCDFAVFRPSTGLWAVSGMTRAYFGASGDLPLPRDYDGDGSADIGIVRFSSGLWAIRGVSRFYFGGSGDYPAPADYWGDGTVCPGIFRGTTGLWAIRGFTRVYYGQVGDIPVSR